MFAATTVKVTGTEAVRLPDVPVTVAVAVPVVATLLAIRVRLLEVPEGFGLNKPVTPLGRPETEKLTLPVNPLSGVREIVFVVLSP